jgi:hypothetical protein
MDGKETAVTDHNGIAMTETAQNSRATVTVEYGGHPAFAYTKPTYGQRDLLPSDRFLSYMYTDRPHYRPSDTVDVFGVIKPRYGFSHSPEDSITLRFGDILEFPVELDAFDSFAMRIPVAGMFGYMDIIVEVNGVRIMSHWVHFLDYTNLSYVMTGTMDKIAYEPGEESLVDILITNFAGLPAEGVHLRGGTGNEVSMVTDGSGRATGRVSVSAEIYRWQDWTPYWQSILFSTVGAEQVSQSIHLPRIVVPRDIMMEYSYDGGDTVHISTHKILVDNINGQYINAVPWSFIERDVYRGPPVDVDFTVSVTRHTTVRTLRSQSYDHINKRAINSYDFNTVSAHYRNMEGRTVNGEATVSGLPVSEDPMVRYTVTIHYHDSRGMETTVRVFDNEWYNFRQESSIRHFGLVPEKRRLSVNETTQVKLVEYPDMWGMWYDPGYSDHTEITNGRLLVVLARDGIVSAASGSPRGLPVTFSEGCISNALLFGAYFDGRYIYPVPHPVSMAYDSSERAMEIDLAPDKESYKPGDEVTLYIQTCKPYAQVLISVIDESSLLDRRREPNFRPRFYGSSMIDAWGYRHFQFASHTQHNFGGGGTGAEMGNGDDGGNDPSFREDFTDNPVFELVRTDNGGVGRLTFTLPDQITSWRVTAIGLTEDGFAGDARNDIISYLNFYVDVLLTNEFIAGDDIAALARVYGSGGNEAGFTFTVLRDRDVIFTDTVSSVREAVFNAGKLPAGEYTLQVTAVYGALSDAVALPFSVAESGMIIRSRARGQISTDAGMGGFAMRPLPVRISLTNATIGPLVNIMMGAYNSQSYRTDAMAAAAYVDEFFSGERTNADDIRSRLHTGTGGIPQLTYEEADFFYTARFAASFPEYVNTQRLIPYIQREIHDASPLKMAAGLLALAAVGEPVLLQIQAEATQIPEGDVLTRLYLAAALIAIGDDTGAQSLVAEMPDTVDSFPDHYVPDLETRDTLLLYINATLNPQAAWAYLNRGQTNQYVSDVAERINFVKKIVVLGGTVSEFQYHLDGVVQTVRLENFERFHLHISKEQFDNLNLTPVSGETDYFINYYGYDAANWEPVDKRIGIRKNMVREGGLIMVDLQVTLPPNTTGFYTIYDRLPSNKRFVPLRPDSNRSHFFHARNTQRQLVEVSFYNHRNDPINKTFSYYAMELFEADMAMGTAYISNNDTVNHLWGKTE